MSSSPPADMMYWPSGESARDAIIFSWEDICLMQVPLSMSKTRIVLSPQPVMASLSVRTTELTAPACPRSTLWGSSWLPCRSPSLCRALRAHTFAVRSFEVDTTYRELSLRARILSPCAWLMIFSGHCDFLGRYDDFRLVVICDLLVYGFVDLWS